MTMRGALLFLLACLALPTAQAGECPRIVSQAPYISESLEWLGLGECIVGASRYDERDVPATGGVLDPDPAAIAALEPELVFVADWTDAATWRDAVPEGTKGFRLHGFRSMAGVAENLRVIADAAGLPDADSRATRFTEQWRAKARAVDGDGTRVLLLSACSGAPYAYGRETWLHDLFTEAGFRVMAPGPRVQRVEGDDPAAAVAALVRETGAEAVIAFRQHGPEQCPLLALKTDARVVGVDGQHFLHPAPVVLEGLDELARAWEAAR